MAGKAGAQVRKTYQYKDARLLTLWAKIGLIYAAVVDLIAALVYLFTPGAGPITAAFDSYSPGQWARVMVSMPLLLGFILLIPFLVWLYRASANAHSLRPGMEGSVWNVYFWYFVPFACLAMPYIVMTDIWHASSGSRARAPAPGSLLLLRIWWGIFLIRGVCGLYARFVLHNDLQAWVFLPGAGLAICLFLIVDKIQRMQMATHLSHTFDAPATPSILEAQTA